jgi:hypothetical protein
VCSSDLERPLLEELMELRALHPAAA